VIPGSSYGRYGIAERCRPGQRPLDIMRARGLQRASKYLAIEARFEEFNKILAVKKGEVKFDLERDGGLHKPR
jgi:hypothetical protein